MTGIDKSTLKILKHISKCNNDVPYDDVLKKFKKNHVPSADNSLFHLSAHNMIAINYDADNEGNRTAPISAKLTDMGKLALEEEQDRNKKHWQNIFLPQTLNIFVSAITTIVTFFILQWLNTK